MKTRLLSAFFLISNCLFLTSLGSAATQPESLTIGYSSFSGDYVPLWMAVDDRLGKKYGLDLSAVYAGKIRPQQLLASGETPFVVATGTGAITSHILMPAMLIAKKKGFRELVSYEKLGIVYPYNTVTTLRATAGKNPELVERFLKVLIDKPLFSQLFLNVESTTPLREI